MAATRKMTETELASVVSGYIDTAKSFGSTRSKDRDLALKFYNGEVDFAPMGEGKSSVVSRDVSDVHGLIMPGLKRAFFASDRLAIYEPTRPQMVPVIDEKTGKPKLDESGNALQKDVSEERAAQATDLVNYVVMKECDGYRQFSSAMSDAVLIGNGVIKHWWDPTDQHMTDTYTGQVAAAKAMVLKDPNIVETFDEEEYPDPDFVAPDLPPVPPELAQAAMAGDAEAASLVARMMAPPEAPMLHRFKVKRLLSKGRLRIMAMPDEEFIIDPAATVLDETCRMAGHRRRPTRSELIAEGYDRAKVDALPSYDSIDDSVERDTRSRDTGSDLAADKSTEFVEVFECFPLVDYDGDGIAERRRVVMAGASGKRSLLVNDVWGDDLPFSDLVPDPQPHAWRGRGIYAKVGDVMRIKTVLIRGVQDNTYQNIAPQREVEDGTYVNPDELYNPTQNGVLWRKANKPPATIVEIPYIADKIMPMVSYWDETIEKRTGVSQRSQALDIDALQNQSATAVNAAQSAAYAQIEDYARNIAECGGMKRVFRCLYRLLVTHQDKAKTVRLRGEWVDIDPSSWASDMDVTVNTGLGTGNRDRDLAMLQNIAAKQEQAMMALGGPANPILGVKQVMDTYQKMAEAAGIRNPEAFFPTITDDMLAKMAAASQQKGPDPELQIKQAELQIKVEAEKAKAQASAVKEKAQMEADLVVAQQQQNFEREKVAMEFEFKKLELAQERELELLKMGMQDVQGVDGVTMARPSTEMLMEGLSQLGQMVERMSLTMNAPTEIVRDPQTGKAVGARKVMN